MSPIDVSAGLHTVLGSGTFGEVVLGEWLGTRVALKVCRSMCSDCLVRNERAQHTNKYARLET